MKDVNQLITDHLNIWTAATKKKSSAGRGNGGAVSLHGINKLRELILELAVRGKLVSQSQTEGTAEQLIRDLNREKSKFITSGTIKKPRKIEHRISPDRHEIPSDWLWVHLDEVGAVVGGGTPKASDPENFEKSGEGFPWLTPADLSKYAKDYIERGSRDLSEQGLTTSSATPMPRDTVLFTSRAPIGYVAISSGPISTNQGFKSVVPFLPEMARYIALVLRCFTPEINAAAPGTTFKEVSGKIVAGLSFPLPPLAEQRRIVAKVDELMTLCDALERQAEDSLKAHQTLVETCLATLTNSQSPEELTQNWTRIETHFDTLFTTEESLISLWNFVLKLAIRGDLVPQKSSEEPASGCLLGINAAKNIMISEGRLRKTKVLKSIEEDEVPFARPEVWAWSRLNDFIDVRDGTHDSPKDARTGDTFPLITSKNFKNGDIDFDSARRISAEDHHEISKRSRVERDDILFSMIGGNLGNQVIVTTDQEFSVKNVALFKYYDRTKSIPDFVKLYMENLAIDLQSQASGGAQPFVSLGFLRNLLIGVPPVDEQKRIVTKARELERLIEATRDRISSSKTKEIELADTLTSKIH